MNVGDDRGLSSERAVDGSSQGEPADPPDDEQAAPISVPKFKITRAVRRPIKLVSGWGLIGLGTVGFVLPILQGWLFVFLGLAILSTEYHWARRLRCKLRRRFRRGEVDDGECDDVDAESDDSDPAESDRER